MSRKLLFLILYLPIIVSCTFAAPPGSSAELHDEAFFSLRDCVDAKLFGSDRQALVREPRLLRHARYPTSSDIEDLSGIFGPRLVGPIRSAISIAFAEVGTPHLAMGEFLATFEMEFARRATISIGATDCGPPEPVVNMFLASIMEWIEKAVRSADEIGPVGHLFKEFIPGAGWGEEYLLLSVALWLSGHRGGQEELLKSYAEFAKELDIR